MCIRSECSTHNTNEFSACVVVGIMGLVNNYEVMINYVTLLLLVKKLKIAGQTTCTNKKEGTNKIVDEYCGTSNNPNHKGLTILSQVRRYYTFREIQ